METGPIPEDWVVMIPLFSSEESPEVLPEEEKEHIPAALFEKNDNEQDFL